MGECLVLPVIVAGILLAMLYLQNNHGWFKDDEPRRRLPEDLEAAILDTLEEWYE